MGHYSPGYRAELTAFAKHLSEHRLRQLDEAITGRWNWRRLRNRSARWLADPKDARARLDARSAGRSRSPQRPAPSERQRAALAEFIETCRQRGQDPWRALERAIAGRRAGLPLAPCRSRG